MKATYTTAELIQILEQEMRATWKGERILLSSDNRLDNPVITKAIDMQKVNKVFAYQDFRSQIHDYQLKHQVSGIIWREASFRGHIVRFPEVHNQLTAIPGDKEILMAAKNSVLTFWERVTENLNFWLVGTPYQQINADYVAKLARQAEWAEVDAALTEVYLGLCWGNPKEYLYKWAKPKSGCDRIIATATKPGTIKF